MFSRALSEEDPIKKIDLILEILQKPLPLAKDDICLRALVLHDLWMNLFLPWLDDAKFANRKYFAEKGGLDLIIQFMNNEDVHYLELREASGYVCWAYGGTGASHCWVILILP